MVKIEPIGLNVKITLDNTTVYSLPKSQFKVNKRANSNYDLIVYKITVEYNVPFSEFVDENEDAFISVAVFENLYLRNGSTFSIYEAIDLKEPFIEPTNDEEYFRGNKTFFNFSNKVLATLLTGLDVDLDGDISSTDSLIQAFGKLQNSLNQKKQLIKQNTDISHTGVTTETIIFNNGFIPAGTFQENDTFRFNIMFGANTNNANNKTGRVYINTTNDLSGSPILIATKTLPSAVNATCLRNLVFKNSLTSQQILRPSANAITDENLSNAAVDLVAIDSTVDLYFIVTGQLATGTDVMGIRSINSKILR